MAGMVIVDVADVAIVACLICELINYYFKNKLVCKKTKTKKRWPCMGMAGVVIDSVGDMATVVIVGVFMTRIVSEVISI